MSAHNISTFNVYRFRPDQNEVIPAFMVVSTAPVNIEADTRLSDAKFETENRDLNKMEDIAEAVKQMISSLDLNEPEIELIVAIHGYNTSRQSVKDWYKDIYKYINKDELLSRRKNTIFIGYRWPSETVKGDQETPFLAKINGLIKALPFTPAVMLWTGLIGSLGLTFWLTLAGRIGVWPRLFFGIGVTLFTLVFAMIFTLVLLRFSLYFRDSYRANQYGVPDLVELMRQIDKNLVELAPGNTQQEKQDYWKNRKIKLSFLGHSMGGFVVTSTVRILSDVFDFRSIGTTNLNQLDKNPSSEIGHVFRLGRLMLVSPDIPVDTILQGRANFLSSSLRRFQESYLFSNEADLALRLASTAANYFSFPANTREHGYRLGNLVVGPVEYGIVNLKELQMFSPETLLNFSPADYLESMQIGSNSRNKLTLNQLQANMGSYAGQDSMDLARNFSFFDCTDYKDSTNYKNKGNKSVAVLSNALRKSNLNLLDYLLLTIQYFFFGKDVHGGYFRGDFSRDLIYGLLFTGMKDYAISLADNRHQTEIAREKIVANGLEKIDNRCREKGIQALVSPLL